MVSNSRFSFYISTVACGVAMLGLGAASMAAQPVSMAPPVWQVPPVSLASAQSVSLAPKPVVGAGDDPVAAPSGSGGEPAKPKVVAGSGGEPSAIKAKPGSGGEPAKASARTDSAELPVLTVPSESGASAVAQGSGGEPSMTVTGSGGEPRMTGSGGEPAMAMTGSGGEPAMTASGSGGEPSTTVAFNSGSGGEPATTNTVVAQDTSTVFQWNEVPQNQNVQITRAIFDQTGYQLFDTQGETIIVPFTNNNLFVMKFSRSVDNTMYFVNTGSSPVLSIPKGGYLENATVASGKWYPFSDEEGPATPEYLAIAPSYSDYIVMGWYPDMSCCGGYSTDSPEVAVSIGFPVGDPYIEIGGSNYYGWSAYQANLVANQTWVRSGYGHSGGYGNHMAHRPFRGAGGVHYASGGHVFRGVTGFREASYNEGDRHRAFDGTAHYNSLASTGARAEGGEYGRPSFERAYADAYRSNRTFAGASGERQSVTRTYNVNRSFGGGYADRQPAMRTYTVSRSFGGYSGARSYSGGGGYGGGRSFGGGYGGGGRSFSGGGARTVSRGSADRSGSGRR